MTQFAESARAAKIEEECRPVASTERISMAPKPPLGPGELPWTPMDGYLILREVKPADSTKGGIVLPEKSRPQANMGVVMAISAQATRVDGTPYDWQLELGDTVMFRDIGVMRDMSCYKLEHDGEVYLVVGSEDITLRAKRAGE